MGTLKSIFTWKFLFGGFIWFLIKKINEYINGESKDAAAMKAIICLALINGFFTRSSPHKPHMRVPFCDRFWVWYFGLQKGQ